MFGLGKDKKTSPPQNDDLGKLLVAMMRDPEKNQDAFYKAFLTSNVFLVGESGDPEEGEKILQGGDKLKVMQWMDPNGNPFIPIFTSQEELEKSVAGEIPVKFIAFNGYDALNMTQGQVPVAINPMAESCLYLVPPQIAQILDYFDALKMAKPLS